jgi:hypothetical protein
VKENEMGGACSKNGGEGKHVGFWWEVLKERDHKEDLDVGGRIILRWILDIMGWHGLD